MIFSHPLTFAKKRAIIGYPCAATTAQGEGEPTINRDERSLRRALVSATVASLIATPGWSQTLTWLGTFGGRGYRNEDLNWDGAIDDADLLIVLFNFGAQ